MSGVRRRYVQHVQFGTRRDIMKYGMMSGVVALRRAANGGCKPDTRAFVVVAGSQCCYAGARRGGGDKAVQVWMRPLRAVACFPVNAALARCSAKYVMLLRYALSRYHCCQRARSTPAVMVPVVQRVVTVAVRRCCRVGDNVLRDGGYNELCY